MDCINVKITYSDDLKEYIGSDILPVTDHIMKGIDLILLGVEMEFDSECENGLNTLTYLTSLIGYRIVSMIRDIEKKEQERILSQVKQILYNKRLERKMEGISITYKCSQTSQKIADLLDGIGRKKQTKILDRVEEILKIKKSTW